MAVVPRINYRNLADGLDYYANLGYREAQAPWTITRGAYEWTSPPGVKDYEVQGKLLVASAEQSFIDMMSHGSLPEGKHQAITPCFRDEGGRYNMLTRPYFMKLELIQVLTLSGLQRHARHVLDTLVLDMCHSSAEFFGSKLPVDVMETFDHDRLRAGRSYDIVGQKTRAELGSYGVRKLPSGICWVYGTGVAEPRLSTVIEMER